MGCSDPAGLEGGVRFELKVLAVYVCIHILYVHDRMTSLFKHEVRIVLLHVSTRTLVTAFQTKSTKPAFRKRWLDFARSQMVEDLTQQAQGV